MKSILQILIVLCFQSALTQAKNQPGLNLKGDSVYWIQIKTDSGVVHAAVAVPKGTGPFLSIVILHGTHGFADEYVQLARRFADNGIVGIAACWFTGRKGAGERFITPIDFKDAPPFVDAPGLDRFRIARQSIDSLIKSVAKLPEVMKDQLVLFGHSRGAGAALDYVITHPGRVRAVILNSAGYPPEVTKRATDVQLPVLILHGTADDTADGGSVFTNIAMARQFEAALRKANKDVETKYYEGSGHNAMFSNSVQFDDVVHRASHFIKERFSK